MGLHPPPSVDLVTASPIRVRGGVGDEAASLGGTVSFFCEPLSNQQELPVPASTSCPWQTMMSSLRHVQRSHDRHLRTEKTAGDENLRQVSRQPGRGHVFNLHHVTKTPRHTHTQTDDGAAQRHHVLLS